MELRSSMVFRQRRLGSQVSQGSFVIVSMGIVHPGVPVALGRPFVSHGKNCTTSLWRIERSVSGKSESGDQFPIVS